MTDTPREQTAELREALAAAMPEHQHWCHAEAHAECCGAGDCDCGVTDALHRVLALPELAALIADAERVRRVRELADELPVNFWAAVATGPVESAYRDGFDAGLRSATADIRRALDGEPQS